MATLIPPIRRPLGMLLVLACATCAVAAPPKESPHKIDVQPAQITRRTFDPKDPPREMPPLSEGEAAVTYSAYGARVALGVIVVEDAARPGGRTRSTVKVTSVEVRTDMTVTVWLPERAPRALVEHEEGHRRISEIYYAKAQAVASEAAASVLGGTYSAEGKDAESARKAAMDQAIGAVSRQYMARVETASAQVQDIYDELNDHGRRNDMSVEEQIKAAIARHEKRKK